MLFWLMIGKVMDGVWVLRGFSWCIDLFWYVVYFGFLIYGGKVSMVGKFEW